MSWRHLHWEQVDRRHFFDGTALWKSQRRTAHMRKYPIDRTTWYIFIWLCMLDCQRRNHGHTMFNKSERGRQRRTERRWRQHEKTYE
jgi:hypothetical protein